MDKFERGFHSGRLEGAKKVVMHYHLCPVHDRYEPMFSRCFDNFGFVLDEPEDYVLTELAIVTPPRNMWHESEWDFSIRQAAINRMSKS